MTMYLHRVGAVSHPKRHTWEPAASALYAVAVGAGVDDTSFTLDTYDGRDQLVYPTFVLSGVLAAESMSWSDPGFQTGDYSPHELVLGEQGIVFHAPIPARGDVNVTTKVAAIYDKGSGALVVLDSLARDNTTGQPMFTASTGVFVTGHGSFGGERGPPTRCARIRPIGAPTYRRGPRPRGYRRCCTAMPAMTATRSMPTARSRGRPGPRADPDGSEHHRLRLPGARPRVGRR